ncbi:MAG: hypothetical protein QW360_03125, partial [Thermofilum sp.]
MKKVIWAIDIPATPHIYDKLKDSLGENVQVIGVGPLEKAEEILKRPIPVEEYRREAEALIASARVKHDEIIEKARKDAENLRNIPQERIRKAIEYVVKT